MDFIQLECFLCVSKKLNFTEAANEISLSQSSVSKHIMRLEKELGVKLFNRNTKNVSLTIPGREFLDHAETLMDEYYNSLRKISAYKNLYSLNIGSIDHLRKVGLTTPIATFLEKFPHISINLEQSDTIRLVNLLLSCKIDLALIAHIIYPFSSHTNISDYYLDNYELHTIVEDEYYLSVNIDNPLSNRDTITWKDLDNEKLIILDNTFSLNTVIKNTLKHTKSHAKIVFESNHVDTLIGLVNDNFGVALLSKRVVEGNPNIVSISMINPIKRNTVLIAPNKDSRSNTCSKFIEHILDYCKE
jgi:DNA-binding transcriptional LysR family regulator